MVSGREEEDVMPVRGDGVVVIVRGNGVIVEGMVL